MIRESGYCTTGLDLYKTLVLIVQTRITQQKHELIYYSTIKVLFEIIQNYKTEKGRMPFLYLQTV